MCVCLSLWVWMQLREKLFVILYRKQCFVRNKKKSLVFLRVDPVAAVAVFSHVLR